MDVYGISDIGLVRESNQDRFLITNNKNQDLLAMVCDGIGGGKAGDVASEATIRYLENAFLKTHSGVVREITELGRREISAINSKVVDLERICNRNLVEKQKLTIIEKAIDDLRMQEYRLIESNSHWF